MDRLTYANRASCWLLLALTVATIITGYGITGKYGVNDYLSMQESVELHEAVIPYMILLFAFHSLASAYQAFRRRGWIKAGRK